jgi:Prenyltransferase and squalene oxidase repeat
MNLPRIRSVLVVLAVLAATSSYSRGQYHPDHPKVVGMVDKAVAFLLKTPPSGSYPSGGVCLTAYTLYKVSGNADHPKIQQGILEAQRTIRRGLAGNKDTHIVYDLSMAAMLLASVNPDAHRAQLEDAREWLVSVQKDHGGFGYFDKPTGDTSQVQYVMLALWTLSKVGVNAPPTTLEGCLRYLKATQDPSGAWGYQGIFSQGGLVPQDIPSKSLGTAGICSFLLACDQLNFIGSRTKDEDGIPKVFERVDTLSKVKRDSKATMNRDDVDETMSRAFRYQERSPPDGGPMWDYYWRYGQERYESLREIVDGKQQKSPAWYNQGVDDLARKQKPDGSWVGTFLPADVDTCLVVLFLIRSTQKAIGKLDEGVTFGGYDLPMDVTSIRMVGEKIVSNKDVSVENLLSLMEDEKNQVSEGMLPKNLALSKNPQERSQQAARLSRLLDNKNALARRLAVRLLGRSEDLSVVPDLIYALTDNDSEIPRLAEEGLRLLSRHLSTVHLGQKPTDEQKSRAVRYWKEWYLGLRPDYVFVDRK